MASLNHCMTSLSLNGKIPARELKDTAATYKAQGMSAQAALIRAVEDKLELVQMDERRIVKAVREAYEQQGGKKRKAKAKPAPVVEKSAPAQEETDEGARFSVAGDSPALSNVLTAWDDAGIKHAVSERKGVITVSQIVVPEDARGAGAGTAAMQQIIDYADQTNQRIALTPSSDFGGNKARLVRFYKRFGFVENKGRNKDYQISESMYREPGARYSVAGDEFEIKGAIDRMMEDKEGEAIITHSELGDIAIVYGDEKHGLAHIARRRGTEFMERLPELLRDGKVYEKPGQAGRIFIGNDRDEAVVRLDRDGKNEKWLLSAYEKHPDLAPATASTRGPVNSIAAPFKVMTPGETKAALTTGITGSVIARLIEHGTIQIHKSAKHLPKEAGKMPRGVQAVTMPDGTIHFVSGSLNKQNARAVLLHEMFHKGAENLIGSRQWGELMGRMGTLYRQAELSNGKAREFYDRARERVAAAKAKGAVTTKMEVEEFAAYAIEEYETNRDNLPAVIRKWIEDMIGVVKAYLVARYGKQIGEVTPAQLAGFAKLAIFDVAAERRGEMFGPIGELFSVSNGPTVQVDGVRRPIENSKGQLVGDDMHKQLAFWRWFKNSAVVDDAGHPLVVYHGTADDFSAFAQGKPGKHDGGWLGEGFYFTTDSQLAGSYANLKAGATPNIMPVYLSIKNPYKATTREKERLMLADRRGDKQAIKDWTDNLKSQGYDGVELDYRATGWAEGSREIVAFRPEQIKSATGNAGTFDPANPDIRYSVNADPDADVDVDTPAGLTPPEQGRLRRLQSQLQDNMNRVKQVQERIADLTGLTELGKSDYYRAETNRPGRIAARIEDGKNHLFAPLMERLAKAGHTPAQLTELLHAMHAEERNKKIAEINPDMPDGGSGMTTEKAAEILRNYSGEGFQSLHNLADAARNITRATLDLKLAYGLITAADHEAMTKMYEHYVPLKGDGEYGPKIKRAMGHGEREEMILDNIARDYDQAVAVGEKNLARQSLLRMVLQFSDSELWTARVPPRGRYVAGQAFNIMKDGKIVASFDSKTKVSAYLEALGAAAAGHTVQTSGGEQVVEFVKPLQDNEVMVYVKGEPVRIQIYDETLAKQLRPLDHVQLHPILEFMRGMNRYLSKIYTGYNPAFILRNAARDMMTGTVNMVGNEGATVAAKAWGKYPAAWAVMLKWAATKKIPDGQAGNYLNEYRMHGGKVGASWLSDLEEQGKTLQRYYDDSIGAGGYLKAGKPGRAALIAGRKVVGGMAHAVEIVNQAFENALRLGLYMALREQGKSPAIAAQAAKQVTVDFDRKGTSTPALGSIYLFFNPAVQGTANGIKTLAKGKHREQAWVAMAGLAALGYFVAAAGMDDDEDRWLGEGWDVRTKNFIMNFGEHQIRVPLSQEFAPVYAFGAAMAEASRGQSKIKAAAHVVSSFIDAYFPLHGAVKVESDNHPLDAGMALIPTALKPYMESAINRNTFGSEIVPETDFTKDRADNLKMNRTTKGSAYDKAAQGIAAAGVATGFSGQYENDITKVSPETLKHFWRTYTGGLGTFIGDGIGAAGLAADDATQVTSSEVPIVKDFWRNKDVKPIRGRYYDLARNARKAIAEFEQAKKAGDGAAMDAIDADPEKSILVDLGKMVLKKSKAASAIRDEAVDINADASLSLAEKRAKLKELEQQEEALYREAIDAFK